MILSKSIRNLDDKTKDKDSWRKLVPSWCSFFFSLFFKFVMIVFMLVSRVWTRLYYTASYHCSFLLVYSFFLCFTLLRNVTMVTAARPLFDRWWRSFSWCWFKWRPRFSSCEQQILKRKENLFWKGGCISMSSPNLPCVIAAVPQIFLAPPPSSLPPLCHHSPSIPLILYRSWNLGTIKPLFVTFYVV